MRDNVLEGATESEVVALARLALEHASPPPHLCQSLRAKGWIITTSSGEHLLTLEGRTLADRLH